MVAGVSAEAHVGDNALELFEAYSIVVSPYVSLLHLDSGMIEATGSAELDLVPSGADTLPSITTFGLEVSLSTEELRIISITNFAGAFSAFSSQTLSVQLPDIGITVTGTILFSPEGDAELRFGADYAFGDLQLLPSRQAGGSGTLLCTGDTCILP